MSMVSSYTHASAPDHDDGLGVDQAGTYVNFARSQCAALGRPLSQVTPGRVMTQVQPGGTLTVRGNERAARPNAGIADSCVTPGARTVPRRNATTARS